jgi:hypothetical protein
MAGRKPSPAQIRDHRARIAAAILGVVLLAVGGIQGPKLLKALNGSSGSTASTAPPTGTTTTGATTGATVSTTPGVAIAGAVPSAGQVDGFGLFSPQDPFRSQMPTPTVASSATSKPSTKKAITPTATATAKQAPSPTVPFVTTASTDVVAAILKINGKRGLFGLGGTFPEQTPIFRFAPLAGKRLRIGVVGGSFADGRPFLLLRAGSEVTLLNQADGSRFVIRLLKIASTPVNLLTSPVATAASTPAVGVPPAASAPAVGVPPAATPTKSSRTTTGG